MQTYFPPSFSSAQLGAQTKSAITNGAMANVAKNNTSQADLTKTQKSAKSAAEDFEAVFINNMLESMFEGVEVEEPFGGGQAETMYRSMILNEYSKNIVKTGGIGIADQVYREILMLQEGADTMSQAGRGK